MQLLRQPDAQPYEIVRLPENPLRHLTHCLPFLCVLTKILCVKYAVTPLKGNAGCVCVYVSEFGIYGVVISELLTKPEVDGLLVN